MPATPVPRVTLVGAAGRSSTARIIAEIAAATPDVEWPPTLVLLSRGDELAHDGVTHDGVAPRSWSEVLSATDSAWTIVAPSSDPRLVETARLTGATVVTFGPGVADIRMDALNATSRGTELVLVVGEERQPIHLALLGEHLAENAAAAIAAAVSAGVDLSRAVTAVQGLSRLGGGVMQPLASSSGALVIDDARSMAPSSVVAALKALAMFGTEGRRTIAVLGSLDLDGIDDMSPAALERHREAHDRIGRIIVRLNIALLIVIGHDARHIHNAAGLEGSWNGESVLVESEDEAYDRVRDELGEGDVVLVKFTAAHAEAFTERLVGGGIR